MTFAEHIEGIAKDGRDFAYVAMWEYAHDTQVNRPVEVKVIWLEPGRYPKEFPPVTTEQMKANRQHWDTAWTIKRVAPQPAREVISLPAGKFLPGGLPDIKL